MLIGWPNIIIPCSASHALNFNIPPPPAMSINPSAASISGVTSAKPVLEKFSKEEVRYLKERLPEYVAAINQGPTKKGDKGEWVNLNILPDFKSHFGYSWDGDGPSMESVNMVRSVHLSVSPSVLTARIQKLKRWFLNNGKNAATTKTTMARPAKKPRVKNALDIFATENKELIVERTRHLAGSEGRNVPGGILNTWKQARQALFDALDPETKERYESQAAEINKRLNSLPDAREIYAYVIFELLRRADIYIENPSSTVTKRTSYRRSQGHYCPCPVGTGASVDLWFFSCKRPIATNKTNSKR